MNRSLAVIAISLLILSTGTGFPEDPVSRIRISDSTAFEVYAFYDSQGLADHYGARIYTPICEGSKCYAVEIDMIWDLTGRFHSYDTLPGKRLTKLDHIPFTDSDYLKLRNILNNPDSPLAAYSAKQLVSDTRISSIDGFTGATRKEIKDAVIEGAVYSCHTLWHIANGPVKDSLQKVTRQNFSKELIQKMIRQDNMHVNYFLIHSFSEHAFAIYLPEVLLAIEQGEGYFAKNALEQFPSELLCDTRSQEFFSEKYPTLDYFTQVALLEKLEPSCLSESFKSTLRTDLDERNTYKNELLRKLTF
jgi:hypothetical protein